MIIKINILNKIKHVLGNQRVKTFFIQSPTQFLT